MRRGRLERRLCLGFRVRVRWRVVVAMMASMVKRETARSCDFGISIWVGRVDERRGKKRKGDIAYENEGPWDVIFLYMEVMDEEDENAGDDDGGEQLAQS